MGGFGWVWMGLVVRESFASHQEFKKVIKKGYMGGFGWVWVGFGIIRQPPRIKKKGVKKFIWVGLGVLGVLGMGLVVRESFATHQNLR